MTNEPTDWKLKLRYGRLKTPLTHYTLMAAGAVLEQKHGFEPPLGPAVTSMRMWAEDDDTAFDLFRSVSTEVGFALDGKIDFYRTDPSIPPTETNHAYDIRFVPFDPKA
ncbi:hypothetical protein [Parvularcula maris]|uniref:hypothetical protein n=1 Tax=Parvularcula maris TaxID=2965077 RepID=UPI002113FEB3|nr:hypothetical protein [Parvularcula maris]